jgi:hypothetical protein
VARFKCYANYPANEWQILEANNANELQAGEGKRDRAWEIESDRERERGRDGGGVRYVGGRERYVGGRERYVGGRERYVGGRERYVGREK